MTETIIPPVKKGQKIKVTITSIGRKGDGVTKYNNYIIMIPQTEINKEYEITITDVYPKYAFGIKT